MKKKFKLQLKTRIEKIIAFSILIVFSKGSLLFATVPSFSKLKSANGTWVDLPAMEAINYFSGLMGYFLKFSIRVATVIGFIGIIWECIQLVYGTMEARKFFTGQVLKWFLFLIVLHIYPAVVNGIKYVGMRAGIDVSTPVLNQTAENLGTLLKNMEEILTNEEALVKKEVWENSAKGAGSFALGGAISAGAIKLGTVLLGTGFGSALGIGLIGVGAVGSVVTLAMTNHFATKAKNLATGAEQSGYQKKVQAIRSIVGMVDENGDITEDTTKVEKYFISPWAVDEKGNNTDYLSPSSLLKLSLFNAQLIWEGSFAQGFEDLKVEGEKTEDNSKNIKKDKKITENPKKKQSILEMGVEKLGMLLMKIILILFLLFTMCACIIQYLMSLIEYTIICSTGALLIPFMLWDGTKDISQRLISTMLQQAMKILMITLMISYAIYIQTSLALTYINQTTNFTLIDMAYYLFSCLLSFTICSHAPGIASALMSGNPHLSMGEFVTTAGAAAAMAGMGARAATTAAGVGGKITRFSQSTYKNSLEAQGAITQLRGNKAFGKGVASSLMEGGVSKEEAIAAGKLAVKDLKKNQASARRIQGMHGQFSSTGFGSGGGGGASGMANASYLSERSFDDVKSGIPQGLGAMMYGQAQNENGTLQSGKEFINSMNNAGKASSQKYLDRYRNPQTKMANGKKPKSEYIGDAFSLNDKK